VGPDRAFDVPANVEVRDHADHAELMPTVSLVVGHGGHATTFSALAHGKPLVILPMHPLLDQPMIAASVVDAGAAVQLKRTASSNQIAHAIATALASAEMRRAAEAIGAHLRTTDAASTTVTQLLKLSRPVTTKGKSR
jgi:UDP:flavonoid glycosyltransferase YjiC (YdhE family)